MNVLELDNVCYRYPGASGDALVNVSARFEKGVAYAVVGESGAGKTTLLSLLAGLDTCAGGSVRYNGVDIKNLDRDAYRAKSVGVVFQSHNLLPESTAFYNVTLSMGISGVMGGRKNKRDAAYAFLSSVGVDRETAGRRVSKLSGGEQQRVGIARALSRDPNVIIADEPTGSLDAETERGILKILARLAREDNRCVIIVTHSDAVAAVADVVYSVDRGRLTSAKPL